MTGIAVPLPDEEMIEQAMAAAEGPEEDTFDPAFPHPQMSLPLHSALECPSLDPLTSDDYAKLACHGIKLMLNNDFVGAEKLFVKHKDTSVHMAVGFCYLTFLVSILVC